MMLKGLYVFHTTNEELVNSALPLSSNCIVILFPSDKYCMVLWDGEDTVSIVHVEQVLSSKTNVGEQCSVKAGRHTYKGKILAVGQYVFMYLHLVYIHINFYVV